MSPYLKLSLLLLLVVPVAVIAANKNTTHHLGTVNVETQLAPFHNYYDTRATWPRSFGWKPYMRYRWDMLQRGWPNGDVPAGAMWEAMVEKQHMRHSNLDEPWVNIGPFNHGGRCRVIRWHPVDHQTMFAGSVSGGMFKSTDGGENWFPLTDFLQNIAVGCFEIDPQYPDTMYLGTGEGYYNGDAVLGIGLLKSTDGGQTWNPTGLGYPYSQGHSILKISIDPRNTQIILASDNDNLKRSINGGQSFTNVLAAQIKDLVRDPVHPDTLFASGGSPWGANSNGIYRSFNNGQTWTRMTNGLPPVGNIGRIVVSIYPDDPQIIYAGICGTFGFNGSQTIGIYRSDDGGTNWNLVSPDGTNHYASQGWYDMSIAVKPGNSQLVISSGLDANRTIDGGATWARASRWDANITSPNYVHADHHETVFDPLTPNTVWEVTDGGIFKSTNSGSTWREKNDGFATFQYYAMGNATLDTALAYGGTQDNGTSRYTGNPDWNFVFGGDGGYCVVDYTDDHTVYVEYQNGHRYRSDDGAVNWEDINPGIPDDGPWVTPMALDPFNHLTLYTTTSAAGGKVWMSPDQGRNSQWQQLGTTFGGGMQDLACSPIMQGRIYVASDNNVYRYDTSVGDWTVVTGNLPNQWVTHVIPDPFNPDGIYATLSGFGTGHVFHSISAGTNWTDLSGNLPDVPTQDLVVDMFEPSTLYVGGDIGVFRTTDDGQTWSVFGTELPTVRVDDMEMQQATGKLRCATHGRGMWEIPTNSQRMVMLFPNGGETFVPDDTVRMRWGGTVFGGNVRIDINRGYPSPNWTTLLASTPNDGNEQWIVSGPQGDHVRFRLSLVSPPNLGDTTNSDSHIYIPHLEIGRPATGDTILSGVRDTLIFRRLLVPDLLRAEFNHSYPDGDWETVAQNIGSDSTAFWITHLPATTHGRIRISSQEHPELTVVSDTDLVLRAPVMNILSPNGGEQLPAGVPVEIRWSAPEHHGSMQLMFNRDFPTGAWERIVGNTPNDGTYTWTPTGPASEHCRIMLAAALDAATFVQSAGDFAITSEAAEPVQLPTRYALSQPYPNPFNPSTEVSLELPSPTRVSAIVYNRIGQEVAVLCDGELNAGRQTLHFSANDLPSGIYFIQIKAYDQTSILKAVMLK